MKRIAIPVFGDRISNRIDCCEEFMLFTVEKRKIRKTEILCIRQMDPLSRLNRLLDLRVDVLICNGITEFYLHKLGFSEMIIIPWISGKIQDVLKRYLSGNLSSKKTND